MATPGTAYAAGRKDGAHALLSALESTGAELLDHAIAEARDAGLLEGLGLHLSGGDCANCGQEIEFDTDLGDWQHTELHDCEEPKPKDGA